MDDHADDALISIETTLSVGDTVARLKEELARRSVDIFALIDHAAAAREVGLELRETQVLLFGNPRVGTLLMQENEQIALALPLKLLIYEGDNSTRIQYQSLHQQAPDYGLDPNAPVVEKLDTFMDSLVHTITS